jgi:pyruvate,water dikinase
VAAALGGRPLRRRLFAWVLRNTRSMVCNRENLRFQRTRGFGLARRIAVETGHRLAALGWLDAAQDVFYLTVEELLALDDGTAVTTDLAALVALRRAEFAAYRDGAEPAARFNSHGSVYLGAPWRLAATPLPADGETLYGIGCCPGLVRGPVRVVRDPGKAQLRSGEILVAERTDPGWVMLFPAAAGLLVERGSVLSHSAIVARELGLPTVVAIEHLTAWLRDGEWVEMDGMAGSVRRVAAPDGADADADADAA